MWPRPQLYLHLAGADVLCFFQRVLTLTWYIWCFYRNPPETKRVLETKTKRHDLMSPRHLGYVAKFTILLLFGAINIPPRFLLSFYFTCQNIYLMDELAIVCAVIKPGFPSTVHGIPSWRTYYLHQVEIKITFISCDTFCICLKIRLQKIIRRCPQWIRCQVDTPELVQTLFF